MIYGDFLREESSINIDESTKILNEMNFSKKELQNPKTLDKILKRKEFFESTTKFFSFLLYALSIAGSITIGVFVSTVASFITFPILLCIIMYIDTNLSALPSKWYEKNYDKFINKINDLKSKMEAKMEKDPEHKEKYQKIIDGCNKVLNHIEKCSKEAEKIYRQEQLKECIDDYEELISWFEDPYTFGHTGENWYFDNFCYMCKYLKITDTQLLNTLKKYYKTEKTYNKKKYNRFLKLDMEDSRDVEGNITIPDNYTLDQVRNDLGKYIYIISSDDDCQIAYCPEKNKIIYSDADTSYKTTSINDEAKHSLNKYSIDILIDADKELGYYRLSKCPDNVKKKPWPIK